AAQLLDHLERAVAAAVVDEHELPIVVGERAHHVAHRLMELAQVVALVEYRHDDGDGRAHGHCQRDTIPTTAWMMRSWSASDNEPKIGRKTERAATSSVTGSESVPYRSRYSGSRCMGGMPRRHDTPCSTSSRSISSRFTRH